MNGRQHRRPPAAPSREERISHVRAFAESERLQRERRMRAVLTLILTVGMALAVAYGLMLVTGTAC